MNKSTEEEIFLCRVANQAQYRSLSGPEKALAIIEEHHVGQRDAADTCHTSQASVLRAKRAQDAGRPVGRVGRPTLLTLEEETLLIEKVSENYRLGIPLTIQDLVSEVKIICLRRFGLPNPPLSPPLIPGAFFYLSNAPKT